MKSRWLTNFLLIIAIGVLTLIARYEPGIEKPEGPRAVTDLLIEQVEHIRVNRPLRDDLVLTRTGNGTWLLEQDPALPADSFQVRALAKIAQHTAVRSYPASDLDLSRLALDPPHATVLLNDTRIDIGSLEPLEELRYVRVGEQVHLISDMYQHLVDADYTQFIRRRLFAEADRITTLQLPDFTLHKQDGKWSAASQQAVSADTLQQLVDNWQLASALYVRPAGEGEGSGRISVTLDEPQHTILFTVVSRKPELVLRRADYHIDYRMGDIAETLLQFPQPATETPE